MHIPGRAVGSGRCAAAAVAAVICAVPLTGLAPAGVPVGGPTPSGPASRLDWSTCPAATGFDCATSKVPLDYREPGGRTIELAVIRHRATGPGHRIGTLFVNPGGPGGAGTKALPYWYDLFPRELRQRFDIVSWDPRGVGDSTAVRCFRTTKEALAWQERVPVGFPVDARERATVFTSSAELGRLCERRDPELLRHVNTADTARDLDRLRQAVGDRQLSYLGVSYGTFLGATYANLFPGNVRAMVLDGNIDPVGWVNGGSKREPRLTTFQRNDADLSAAATLKQFLDLCGRATRDRCAFSAGSPEATRDKFNRLLRRLEQRPQGSWTYAATVSLVHAGLYTVHPGWTTLATQLETLWQRRTPQGPPPPPSPVPYPGFEQIDAVRCGESPNPPDTRRYTALDAFSRARAGDIGRIMAWATSACATWPVTAADPYTGPWNRPTAGPVLVVNTTFDPATPYQGARAMSRLLADARLLTVQGYGHAVLLNPSRCASDYESRYLVDGVLPPPGATCRQDTPPFSRAKPRGGMDTGGGALDGRELLTERRSTRPAAR
ncbi:alpha/beta hydrolase [Streptomyces sp. NPDC002187]|uniref:alpha/beta hydrolase n=1 Tax=Streptomyces sp. NPDC002187 TaxID=3364637 RepID=UPI0036C46219